jgi:hypothetical protein
MKRREFLTVLAAAIVALIIIPGPVFAQAPGAGFVAPPRTIADITAILDQEKPDRPRSRI